MSAALSKLVFLLVIPVLLSCQSPAAKVDPSTSVRPVKRPNVSQSSVRIVDSKEHQPNYITCDLGGDQRSDSVKIVRNLDNGKYGLKIIFGNKQIQYLGMGKDVLGQGFDNLDWIGIFERVPKGNAYFNNVDEEGDIISEEEVKPGDKIMLDNDGIFIHQAESCGGGIIYLKNGKFAWIQQE
ncbi:MAG: hypothetical protein REI78_14765 [Pedobacter sp.]|nr:hypothetical protein [Pedobacter sp.]